MYIPRGKISGEPSKASCPKDIATNRIMVLVDYSTLLQVSGDGVPNYRYLLEPLTPSSLSFLLFSQDEMQ